MSFITHWGYTLTEIDTLPSILDVSGYNTFTADKYSSDKRAHDNLMAASDAVRNYCGWHIFPTLECELSTTFFDKRISQTWAGVLVQLPATYVTEVESVTIDGVNYTDFAVQSNGLLRVKACGPFDPWTTIVIVYSAGLPISAAAGLRELIAHRVTHALASSNGVQSEAAGGVSITYNATWTNNARATALADDNKDVLSPYRLRGVF